jgi:hypothetical protein
MYHFCKKLRRVWSIYYKYQSNRTMQKGMPNFYEYNGQRYSVCFPVEWATTHIEGTGPEECHICNIYGCDNDIFKSYCQHCSEQYSDNPRNTGEESRDLSIHNHEQFDYDYDNDNDMSIIPDDTDEGIGCNRCYSCVTGGSRPCELELLTPEPDDVDNDTIISDVSYDAAADELDNITIINHTCNHYDLSTNVTLDLQSNDGSVNDMNIDVGIGTDSVHDISLSAVKPLFDVATYNAEEDIFAEMNRYIEENPRYEHEYDDEQGFGVGFGLHQYNGGGWGGVDAVAGYDSY